MNRLEALAKIDELEDLNCKSCKFAKRGIGDMRYCLSKCSVGKQLQGLGKQLESIKKERKPLGEKKPVLDIDTYKMMNAQGKTDSDIAKEYGISQPTISYYKKKWFKDSPKPSLKVVEQEKESTPNKSIPKKNESELGALVSELSEKLESEKKKVEELEAKVKELEHLNAACSDVEEETNELQLKLEHERKAKEWAQEEYSKTLNKLHNTDVELENTKNALKDTQRALGRYIEENKAMRKLLQLWM